MRSRRNQERESGECGDGWMKSWKFGKSWKIEQVNHEKKASQDAILKNVRYWQRWKKRNKTSNALMTSPAKKCRVMQCTKLLNKNRCIYVTSECTKRASVERQRNVAGKGAGPPKCGRFRRLHGYFLTCCVSVVFLTIGIPTRQRMSWLGCGSN